MVVSNSGNRQAALVVALGVATVAWALFAIDSSVHGFALEDLVQCHVRECESMATDQVHIKAEGVYFVTRRYLLVGQASAKVSIYARSWTDNGKERYWSVDYFYVHEKGGWRLLDSGACTSQIDRHNLRSLLTDTSTS